MDKPIEIILLKQAEDFLDGVGEQARKKFFFSFRKTKSGIFGEWFKKMAGTDSIYEFRIESMGKFYRLFSFWDSRGEKETLIVCTHGLTKKSNKTPRTEIDKAEEIRRNYFQK